MFGKKNKGQQAPIPAKQESATWNDQLSAAEPQKSAYFDCVRTHAYENQHLATDYVEFWVALQVDRNKDLWRVMHYMIFDLQEADGKFKSTTVSDKDCSFAEAMYHMSKFDSMATALPTHTRIANMEERFPVDKYPELKAYFFDVEYYKLVANILHMAFDEAHHPYRTIEGKVFLSSTFKRSEVVNSILAAERAQNKPGTAAKIEAGVLSDIYNAASGGQATLDSLLKAGEMLAELDSFASYMVAFYLGVQKCLQRNDKLDKIQGLSSEERGALYKRGAGILAASGGSKISEMLSWLLPDAAMILEGAKEGGVHVEPFQKHLAECELYAHLLNASQNRSKFQASLQSATGADTSALADARSAIKKAQDKFIQLGGTLERFDRLQEWVANDKKELIPAGLTGFLERYYTARRRTMKAIQDKKSSALRDANTMPVKVKPADVVDAKPPTP